MRPTAVLRRSSLPVAVALLALVAGLVCAPAANAVAQRPVVTALSRHFGPAAGGTSVTIHGRYLRHAYAVDFGTRSSRFTVISSRAIRVRTPSIGRDRSVHVTVRTRSGRSDPDNPRAVFTFVLPPRVTGLSRHAGPLGGARLTVFGQDFRFVTAVTAGGLAATDIRRESASELRITVPAHQAGTVNIRVRTAFGRSPIAVADEFRYVPPPQITRVLPADGSAAGGRIVRIEGVHLSGGTKVTFGGVEGSIPVVALDTEMYVTAPPHSPGDVDVRVTTAGGTSAASPVARFTYTVPNPQSWTSTKVLDVFRGAMRDISCIDMDTCLAIDRDSSYASTNGTWGPRTQIDTSGVLNAISCSSGDFCVAVDSTGAAFTWSGSAWSGPQHIASFGLSDVSCPDLGQCIAVGSGGEVQMSGGVWSDVRSVGDDAILRSVSCADSGFCIAVTDGTTAFGFDGTSWSGPTSIDAAGALQDVSCPSRTFCTAIDQLGGAVRWDGASWSDRVTVFDDDDAMHLSCTSAGRCVATSLSNLAAYWDGSGWTTTSQPITYPRTLQTSGLEVATGLSCAGAITCIAVDAAGDTIGYDSGTWSAPVPAFVTNGYWSAISCTTPDFCAATDTDGNAYTYDGAEWSAPSRPTALFGAVTDVSCVSSTFCLMVSSERTAAVFDGVDWTPIERPDFPASSISCLSTTLCVGISQRWDGSHWTALAPPELGISAKLSCSGPTFCAAVGGGKVAVYTSGVWGPATVLDAHYGPAYDADHISCPAVGFCLVADAARHTFVLRNGTWSQSASFVEDVPSAVSCSSPTSCVMTEFSGESRTFDGEVWSDRTFTGSDEPFVWDLSCAGADRCVAIGRDTVYTGQSA